MQTRERRYFSIKKHGMSAYIKLGNFYHIKNVDCQEYNVHKLQHS